MNKHCYRLIYSRTHGELRVVGELARSCNTTPGQQRSAGTPRLWVTICPVVWLLGLALCPWPVGAGGIVADIGAEQWHQPEVIATQNGLPQVNITAPNQAGISHNHYHQFDIDQKGAILNNSAVMTSTQIAGIIQGNPNLHPDAAPARIILNEVNSDNPSQLRGYLEVAGGRAQVIVANPAGIICDGCGTINAGRMTLTTGKPQLNADGSLAGYQVERGIVRLEGGGLNGDARHDTEYVEILARAVEVNAGVRANEGLTIIAGRNHISADGRTVTPQDADSAKPEIAIDMGQMGGMYSGHIRMIGTEAGVGVRNQGGHLQAGKTLVVSSAGRLSWQAGEREAVTQAGGDITLAAKGSIAHSGNLYSGGTLSVQSREGELIQSGTLAAAGNVCLNAAGDIHSSGHLLAGSNADSQLVGRSDLLLDSQGNIRASGSLMSKKDITLTAQRVDISEGTLAAERTTITTWKADAALRQAKVDSGQFTLHSAGNIDARQAQVTAGRWDVNGGTLFNQNAGWLQLDSGESRFALTGTLDNNDGLIEARLLGISAAALNNRRGHVAALSDTAQYWRIEGEIDNNGGELSANGNLTVNTGSLDNRTGTLNSRSSLRLSASTKIHNSQGKLRAGKRLEIDAGAVIDNQSGMVYGDQIQLTAPLLINAQGQVISQGDLSLTANQALDNTQGLLTADGQLVVRTDGNWNNRGGSAQGYGEVAASARTLDNSGGRLQSGGELTLSTTENVINEAGILTAKQVLTHKGGAGGLLNNDGGTLQSDGALSLQCGRLSNRRKGSVLAQQELSLDLTGDWDNEGGTITGKGDVTVSATGLNNSHGSVNAQGDLNMTMTGVLDNSNGRIFSGSHQTLQAQSIINAQGCIKGQGEWTAVSGHVDNREGNINTQQDMTISAATLDNGKGLLQSDANQRLRIGQAIHNTAGKVIAKEGLFAHGAVEGEPIGKITNVGGQWLAGGKLNIAALSMDNTQDGVLRGQNTVNIRLADGFDNRQGNLISGKALTLDVRSLQNAAGTITSQQHLALRVLALLDNNQGEVRSDNDMAITAGRIENPQGVFNGRGELTLTAGELQNANGSLISQGAGIYRIEALRNQQGNIQSAGTLTINTRALDNQGGTLQGQQALALTLPHDYTHRAGSTLTSNGLVSLSVAGVVINLTDWLLSGSLSVNSAQLINQGSLVGKIIQLTTGRLLNQGRLEAGNMTLNVDFLDNASTIIGDDIKAQGRIIDNHGHDVVIAASRALRLQSDERLTNRDGALLYSGGDLFLGSKDLIENRASTIESAGDVKVESNRLDNLREGLIIDYGADKSDYKWHRYNYYWRSYGSGINYDKNTMTPTVARLSFRNEADAQNNRYGTLQEIDAAGKRAQVLVTTPQGQFMELWVNYQALKPNADGSYDMTFYETRGPRQNRVPTPYHNTVWREFDRGHIEQWDPEKHIDIGQAPLVDDYSNFRERSATGTVTRDILVSEGTGARILSGGNMEMRVTGQLFNDASVITANGNLDIDGVGRIENKAYSINERRQEYLVDHYDKDTVHWYPTFNHDASTELTTIGGIIHGNGSAVIKGSSLTNTTVNQAQTSSIEAALQALDAERAEWERNPLSFGIDGISRQDGGIQNAPGTHSTHLLGRPILPAELALTQRQQVSRVATDIPNNGLFRQHTATGSPFLVVTDERFTSRSKFTSSDYLLARVGYDPAQVHKRLGDGFYEQRLVSEQLLKLTGRTSERGKDTLAYYQQLMNNGSKVAADFQLVPGVALTPEQITALTQDIVWLVSETVETAEGSQKVWVPKVYLSHATLRLTSSGALISGDNLQLSAASINNAGNLIADRELKIEAEQFTHQGGDIKADAINVQADSLTLSTNLQDALRQAAMSAKDINLSGTDLRLQGAKLDATNTLSLSARNNLDITAAKSSHIASLDVIAGSMGDRTAGRANSIGLGMARLSDGGGRLAGIQGEWQQALGSQLNAGGSLNITAGRDIRVQGSQANAGAQLNVQAGGDVNLLAETATNNTQLTAASRTSSVSNNREEDRLLPSTLGGAQGVSIIAGDSLLVEGAQVGSTHGRLGLSARDIHVKEARQRVNDQDNERTRLGKTNSRREMATSRDEAAGSTLSGRNGVTVFAHEGSIAVTGSTLHSEQGNIALQSKQDVKLNSATERESTFSETHSEKRGVANKSTSHRVQDDRVTREVGSLLSGESISVIAGNDLTLTGSAIAADQTVDLQAGNDVVIAAAIETESHYLLEEHSKSGLSGSGGIGFSVGNQSTRHEVNKNGTTQSQSVSMVGSSQGSVNIQAGNQLHIGGADLVAGKDLSLTGDSVRIDAGYDKRTQDETFEAKQSGFALALSGTVGSALNTAVSTAQQARKESDSRLGALQNTKAALSGIQAVQAYNYDNALTEAADAKNAAAGLQAGDEGAEQGATNTVGITLSYGSQSSKSETRTQSSQARSSTLNAGRNLSITATGKKDAPHSGDITITGNQLKAGNDLSLNASRDINLMSAQNTERTEGTNSSEGGNVGVGIGVGSGGAGLSVSASINKGKGHHKGNSLIHTETTLDAGNGITLTSGRDTTLKGAQVSGERIAADIGRNLTLQSEQNSDHYDAKQQSISAGGSFTFGTMTGSGSVNISRDKLKSDYDSVKEQTGLFAGKGGYDIKVGKHTQLDGAVIASKAGQDKNTLDTGTLGWSDIHNQADFTAEHQSAGFNSGGPVGSNLLTNMSALPISGANNSGHSEGTTKAAVSAGNLIIRDKNKQRQDVAELSRDTDNANGSINPIFDQEKEQKRLRQAQLIIELGTQMLDIYHTQATTTATREATHEARETLSDPEKQRALRDEAKTQLFEARKKHPDVRVDEQTINDRAWQLAYQPAYDKALETQGAQMGGNVRMGVNAAVSALQALAGGDVKAALAQGAAPYVAEKIKELTTANAPHSALSDAQKLNNTVAHAVLGGVIAELSGGNAVAGATGAVAGELAAPVIAQALYGTADYDKLTSQQKEKVSALATLTSGIAAGVGSGDMAGAVTGAQAGKNAVENNFLTGDDGRAFEKEWADCKASGGDCGAIVDKYAAINAQRNEELQQVCEDSPLTCASYQKQLVDTGMDAATRPAWMPDWFGAPIRDEEIRGVVQTENAKALEHIHKSTDKWDRLGSFVAEPENVLGLAGTAKSFLASSATTTAKATGAALSLGANAGMQIYDGKTGDKFDYASLLTAGVSGTAGVGKSLDSNVRLNVGGAYLSSQVNGEDSQAAMMGATAGAAIGYGIGAAITRPWEAKLVKEHFGMPASKNAIKYSETTFGPGYLLKETKLNPVPGIFGGVSAAITQEATGSTVQKSSNKE